MAWHGERGRVGKSFSGKRVKVAPETHSERRPHQAPPRLMFMRSASEEVAACAQQEPLQSGKARAGAGHSSVNGGGSERPVCGFPAAKISATAPVHRQPAYQHFICPSPVLRYVLVARGAEEVAAASRVCCAIELLDIPPIKVQGQLLFINVGVW